MNVDAVTFDFWNTLMWEYDGALVAARTRTAIAVLNSRGIICTEEDFRLAHAVAFAEYQRAWHANRQYCAPDAVRTILMELGHHDDSELFASLVTAFDAGGRQADVRVVDGAVECLDRLRASGIRLGIICDIGLTPSPVVRDLLDGAGLLSYFDVTVFSDEVGVFKPDVRIFELALRGLGAPAERAAHVGDRRRTDVAGAVASGMAAILFTGIYDDPDREPDAAHTVRSLSELADLIEA